MTADRPERTPAEQLLHDIFGKPIEDECANHQGTCPTPLELLRRQRDQARADARVLAEALRMANERANRWQQRRDEQAARAEEAEAEVERLQAERDDYAQRWNDVCMVEPSLRAGLDIAEAEVERLRGVVARSCGAAGEHEHMATVERLHRCPICDARFEAREARGAANDRTPHTHGGTDAPECTPYGIACRPNEKDAHELDTTVRPAACSCGVAKFAGSPTFVRRRHAAHVEEESRFPPPDETRDAR